MTTSVSRSPKDSSPNAPTSKKQWQALLLALLLVLVLLLMLLLVLVLVLFVMVLLLLVPVLVLLEGRRAHRWRPVDNTRTPRQ